MAKAFIMGILNGLIDLIVLVLKVASFLLNLHATLSNLDNLDNYYKVRKLLEYVEDVWDVISTYSKQFISSIVELLKEAKEKGISAVMNEFMNTAKSAAQSVGSYLEQKIDKTNKYDAAYYAGYIVFDVTVNVILAIYTGGASAIAKAASASEKWVEVLKLVGKEALSSVSMGVTDAIQAFKGLIIKFIEKARLGLSKFLEWIKELFGKNGDEIAQEARKIGDFGFEVLSDNLLQKYLEEVIELSRKKGINLEIKWIDESHPQFYSNLAGRLGTSSDKKNLILELRKPCPKITWHHENWHLDDFIEMGYEKYRKLQKEQPWILEENVWNKIFKNRNKFKENEVIDAYKYYKRYCDDRNIEPKINKFMENLIKKL